MKIVRVIAALAALLAPAPLAAQNAPLLVDAAWLSQHLNDRNLVVLQVDDESDYRAGHIPGARFTSMGALANPKPTMLDLPAPDDLRSRLQALGISDDSRIVVTYGKNGPVQSATRVILTLDYMGLGGQTSLLNGGNAVWSRAGQTLSTAAPAITPGTLTAKPTKPVVVDAEFVKSLPNRPAHILVDARAPSYYRGIEASMGALGHITGAVNIPFTDIYDSQLLLDPSQIEKRFRAAGVKPGDTVVAYCHIGQQGTAVVFGARLLGHPVVLYDGSMHDWETNKRGPLVK